MDHGYHPHYSVMINETLKGFFWSSRGLRQGDPSSPFLFTLVADAFSALMNRAVESSIINGFVVSKDEPFISYLWSSDNSICFVDVGVHQVANLKLIMRIYESISGLKLIFQNLVWRGFVLMMLCCSLM